MKLTSVVVTLWYRALEVRLGLPYNNAVDIWSAGYIIADMFSTKTLFPGSSEGNQLDRIFESTGTPSSKQPVHQNSSVPLTSGSSAALNIQSHQQQGVSQYHHNNVNTINNQTASNSNGQRKNVISTCVTVGDSDTEVDHRRSPKYATVKYEPHSGGQQSQKKRLLVLARNECLVSSTNQLHAHKQETAEF